MVSFFSGFRQDTFSDNKQKFLISLSHEQYDTEFKVL